MFQWKECLKRVEYEREREVAKINGVNEGTRTVVLMKEEAYVHISSLKCHLQDGSSFLRVFSRTLIAEQCVVRYNLSSGSSLVLHILKPYDFGFEPPKQN